MLQPNQGGTALEIQAPLCMKNFHAGALFCTLCEEEFRRKTP